MRPDPHETPHEVYRVTLVVPAEGTGSPTPMQALRRWLKALLRVSGIRCVGIERGVPDGDTSEADR